MAEVRHKVNTLASSYTLGDPGKLPSATLSANIVKVYVQSKNSEELFSQLIWNSRHHALIYVFFLLTRCVRTKFCLSVKIAILR